MSAGEARDQQHSTTHDDQDGETRGTSTKGGREERGGASGSGGGNFCGRGAEGSGSGGGTYGREEVSALKGIFHLYDAENTGMIRVNELEGILEKVGHSSGENSALSFFVL